MKSTAENLGNSYRRSLILVQFAKDFASTRRSCLSGDQKMINPISNASANNVHQASQPPAERKPDPTAQTPPVQKSGAVSQDQVTLKSAGQADHDADGK
jgi:hypothetical protein